STALLQPVVTASGLAVDLKTDVGPTLSATASVKADVKGVDVSAGATPPVDVLANVVSSNMKVDAVGRYEKGVVKTTGDGVKISVAQGASLAQRLMIKPGVPATIEISGTGAMVITVKDF